MKNILLICCAVFFSFAAPNKKTTVWLMGDSTLANKDAKVFPEMGWGMPFKYFFDSTVVVNNRAKNGRSTRTFISEGYWKAIADSLKKGDYVFIQFGHNDQAKDKPERYASPEEFKSNLLMFVKTIKAKKATAVLLSPVSRRKFDKNGMVVETHPIYADVAKEVATLSKTPFVDLNAKSKALYQQFGEENSKLLFLQLDPGEHPNYPAGKADNTHFTELGARKIAQLVLAEIKALNLELVRHIVKPQ